MMDKWKPIDTAPMGRKIYIWSKNDGMHLAIGKEVQIVGTPRTMVSWTTCEMYRLKDHPVRWAEYRAPSPPKLDNTIDISYLNRDKMPPNMFMCPGCRLVLKVDRLTVDLDP